MTNQEKLKELFAILDELDAYERVCGKIQFDMECCAPPDGMAKAGEDMAVLGKQIHRLTHDPHYTQLLCDLHSDSEGLTPIQKKTIEHLYDDYAREKNISAELSYEMDMAAGHSYSDWLTAKQNCDFSRFRDSFASLIRYCRMAIDLRDSHPAGYYNTCLDDLEKGMDEQQLDAFFGAIKTRIVPLLKRVQAEGKPVREDFLSRPVPIPQQEAFSRWLLEQEGLKQSALVLMTTEHPFTTNFGPEDVRVTTHYYEDHFISSIFSTLHEGGHALFMQNEPSEVYENHCAERMTNGMHETISRFFENLVGRSEAFVHFMLPKLREITGGTFSDISEREFYEAVNISRPSLVRTEADELSYCLHIMVRYELEKAFVNGTISVDEIPALWNAKYKEYLGLDVPNDSVGCLQDVHWSGCPFGYFPSYALGNAYGAQILHRMKQDLDVDATIRTGELSRIAEWLKERVFSIASLSTPDEWIRGITGEPLNVNYYLDYLENKYKTLYALN